MGVMPLLELRILEIHSFPHFSLTCFKILTWILHMTLFYCTTGQVWVSSICVNFYGSYTPFGTQNTENTQFSALFSYMLWHIELKFCIWLFFLLYFRSSWVLSICVNFYGSYAPFGTYNTGNTIIPTFLLHALTFWADIFRTFLLHAFDTLSWILFTVLQIKFDCQ